jgi:DNA-binding transcriptional ArsR family regulator
MLAYVPVIFDAYRLLRPRLWPVMQILVAHADRAGCCWPSVRRIADLTGVPRSTVSRYLATLERAGHLSRTRRPGGVYVYQIAVRWLPSAVSHRNRAAVPATRPKNDPDKKIPAGQDDLRWEARLRGWQRRKQWLGFWGPKPSEPGCWAPPAMLAALR